MYARWFAHAHEKYPSMNVDNIRAGIDAVKCLQYRSPPDFLTFFQNDIGE